MDLRVGDGDPVHTAGETAVVRGTSRKTTNAAPIAHENTVASPGCGSERALLQHLAREHITLAGGQRSVGVPAGAPRRSEVHTETASAQTSATTGAWFVCQLGSPSMPAGRLVAWAGE